MQRTLFQAAFVFMTAQVCCPRNGIAATFGSDVEFLRAHTSIIVLRDPEGSAKVALAPAWQGRVMTSTAAGDAGRSFGWINRELIASGKLSPHINAFGGEDRFWLGPEGGQFSIFFAPGSKFEFSDWQTPAALDALPFKVISQSRERAAFSAEFALTNYSGTRFQVAVNRQVRLLDAAAACSRLGVPPSAGLRVAAYESHNKITNAGKNAWKKETGLLSIWILGMFNSAPRATIIVPFKPGPESDLGVKVTSDYFGSIPPERLRVTDSAVFLRADSKFRSKIGINPKRSKGILASYDPDSVVLTLVQFTQPADVVDYVNSLWKLQDSPYAGDAANAYNDGPAAPGAKPLGPFYELESSSPAAALAPGQSLAHVHCTVHLSGDAAALDKVARSTLGMSLAEIQAALKD